MADTKIEWADKVWNPLIGCTYASPGCTNCYAVDQAWIRSHHPDPRIRAKFAGTVDKTAKGARHWTGQINFDEAALLAPLGWKKPRRVFVNSMTDLFHENVTDEQIDRVFAVMALCPQHQFLILTKRAERMREYMTGDRYGIVNKAVEIISNQRGDVAGLVVRENMDAAGQWPLPNVWLGVSVENQQAADERIPHLLATPAAVRWISAEPLLGPVDLTKGEPYLQAWLNYLDWVVCGGESGKDARPMHPDWARSLRDQCAAAGVAFNFKQWGEWEQAGPHLSEDVDEYLRLRDGSRTHVFPDHAQVVRVGKKRAGRTLDGVLHDAFPILPGTGRGTSAAGGGAHAA